ncbi:MAG TPA: thioredoxin domain-containing protein [Acidimicrobiia bacterium]|nr:thioredoxin domain-containing protein [Acidimicrobiia bacterium]
MNKKIVKKNESKTFTIVIAVVVVFFLGLVILSIQDKNEGEKERSAVAEEGSSNYYGKSDSPVTLTEFVDFQCEACYAYYPIVKELKEKYKDRVRFQIRNFPISSSHQFATQAAHSAEAAGRQGRFFEMHDKIFEGQKIWERSADPTSYFESYAQDIGLDMDQFRADVDSADVAQVVNKDLQDVQDLGGTGTPTFVLNGVRIDSPPQTIDDFSKILDDALAQAG